MNIYYDSDRPIVRIIFRNDQPISTRLQTTDGEWIYTDAGTFRRSEIRDVSLEDDSAPFHIDDWMAGQ